MPSGAQSVRFVAEERKVFHGIRAQVQFEAAPNLAASPRTLLDRVWAEFDRVARVANAFDPRSEVGRLNASTGVGAYQVSKELSELFEQSLWASRVTQGAFDVTVWPLKRLWREAAARGREPDPAEVNEVLARVGWLRIGLLPDARIVWFDRPGMGLDFGGIAKGWAVDRVARLLESAGVRNYLVRCGGEVTALGRSPRGEPWAIGIRNPFHPKTALGVLSGPRRLSVSTSGPTEQPLRVGGRLAHHILDPRTGWPADLSIISVTVVILGDQPQTARADALSTALAVLGPEDGVAVLDLVPEAHALFVVPGEHGDLHLRVSSGLQPFFWATGGSGLDEEGPLSLP